MAATLDGLVKETGAADKTYTVTPGKPHDLLVLKGDKELSFGERKMLDTARSLLVKEPSIAKAHPEEKIMEELKAIFAN